MSARAEAAVRRAGLRDAQALAALHVRAWQAAYRGILDDAFLRGLSAGQRLPGWTARLADPAITTFVAERAGRLAGFVVAGRSRDPTDLPGKAEIHSLYVDEASWRAGIGSALLARAVERLREQGFTDAVVWVLAENLRARTFYEARGFAPGAPPRRTVVLGGRPCEETRYAMSLARG